MYLSFKSVEVWFNFHFIFDPIELPDPIDHATGLEKKELLAALAGNDDPYHMKAIKRGVGTKDKPTLIPSAFDARMLGCICTYPSPCCCSVFIMLHDCILPNLNSIQFILYSRSWRSDVCSMDVVVQGCTKAMRVWSLV